MAFWCRSAGDSPYQAPPDRLQCCHGVICGALKFGACRVLSYQIGRALEDGTLQSVLDGYEPAPLPIHLVNTEGRRAPAKTRAFIELAKERLRGVAVLN